MILGENNLVMFSYVLRSIFNPYKNPQPIRS